jgi:hypothetical protein
MNSSDRIAAQLRARRNPVHPVGSYWDDLKEKGKGFLSDAADQAIEEGKQKTSDLVHEHAGSTAGRIVDAGLGVETPPQQAPIDYSVLSRISPLLPVTQSIIAQNQQQRVIDAARMFNRTQIPGTSSQGTNQSIFDQTQRQTSEQKSEGAPEEKKPMNKGLIIGGVIAGVLLIGGGVYFATRDTQAL